MANFTPNQNDYKNLTPFKTWLLLQINTWGQNNFPFVESDFDELTNYGMMQKLMKALNDVISNENMVEEDMTNLYNAFTELQTYLFDEFADYKNEVDGEIEEFETSITNDFNTLQNYVDNYFDNNFPQLVNDKLDEMAEDGTLENLLNDSAHLTKSYNTYTEMIADSSSFTNGLRLKTLGYYSINDGGAGEYYVSNNTISTNYQIELSNGLYLNLVCDDYINIKQIGAKDDGVTDNSTLFNSIIDFCNTNLKNIFIPCGTYVIANDLHDINSGIKISGVKAMEDVKGSIILDKRDSTNYLLNIVFVNLGTIIENIYFQYGGTNYAKCLYLARAVGWDGLITNCKFAHYKNTAITSQSNDTKFINLLIHNCGGVNETTNDIYYAIHLTQYCNENKFVNCHIEHCRFPLLVDSTAFLNTMINSKIELSYKLMNGQYLQPPISITSTSANVPIEFDSCEFINLDIMAYSNGESNFDMDTIPFMITASTITLVNSKFICGNGSGQSTFAQSSQSRYLKVTRGIITGNYFNATSYSIPSIDIENVIFENNFIKYNNTGTFTGTMATNPCIVRNKVNYTNFGLNNFSADNNTLVPIYDYYIPYKFRSGNNNYLLDNLINFGGEGQYLTLVVEKNKTANSIFAPIEVFINTMATQNNPSGKFSVYVVFTSSVQGITLIDKSGIVLHGKTIYCFTKEHKLYIQIPISSFSANIIKISGMDGNRCFTYIDKTQTSLITDYSSHLEISDN